MAKGVAANTLSLLNNVELTYSYLQVRIMRKLCSPTHHSITVAVSSVFFGVYCFVIHVF